MPARAGAVVLFGSGETSGVGRDALRWLVASGRELQRITVLETPAGFEPNADAVARRWTEFFERQDASQGSAVAQLPLRRRAAALGTDDPEAARPLLGADLVALGAGSPTYAVRHLRDSLAWRYVSAARAHGASLFLASAAAVAAGTLALPVYEIYKVGEDPHWKDGLGVLEPFGLSLAIVPHWDNTDGGDTLDTSHCFIGAARFAALAMSLPAATVVVGLEEHTALAIDVETSTASVIGHGGVEVIREGLLTEHRAGSAFPLSELGPFALPDRGALVPEDLARLIAAERPRTVAAPEIPAAVAALIAARERARSRRAWAEADALRRKIGELGWTVEDTAAGPSAKRAP